MAGDDVTPWHNIHARLSEHHTRLSVLETRTDGMGVEQRAQRELMERLLTTVQRNSERLVEHTESIRRQIAEHEAREVAASKKLLITLVFTLLSAGGGLVLLVLGWILHGQLP